MRVDEGYDKKDFHLTVNVLSLVVYESEHS